MQQNLTFFLFLKMKMIIFFNNFKTCFLCYKSFKSSLIHHRCDRNLSCFSCRKILASKSTYLHQKLMNYFCDGNLASEKEWKLCSICNATLKSEKCAIGHKRICYGLGHLGALLKSSFS